MGLFRKSSPPAPWVSAIVAAAGASARMEGIDKQRAVVGGLPVVVRSIEALSGSAYISEIILVCPGGHIHDYYAIVRDYGLSLVSSVAGGAASRQESVFAGVAACGKEARYFLIHDGARPLVTPELVDSCVEAAFEDGAAAVGTIPKDTVKQLGPGGWITGTLQRENLALIQTPQVFEAELYRSAMALARREGQVYTDDCQLVERTGKKIRLVPGSYENIKVTTQEDIALAGAILRHRGED